MRSFSSSSLGMPLSAKLLLREGAGWGSWSFQDIGVPKPELGHERVEGVGSETEETLA